jgi:hypothetical protein
MGEENITRLTEIPMSTLVFVRSHFLNSLQEIIGAFL